MIKKNFDPEKLLQDLKKGKVAATEFLFKQHHKVASQYIEKLIPTLDDADVIYFDAFRQLLLRIHCFNSIDEIRIFFFDAIAEACIKFLQDKDDETIDTIECVNSGSEVASCVDRGSERMEVEVMEALNDVIDSFPQKYYYVCKLFYLGGMRNKDVADFLNVSPQDVYKLRKRCAKWLKKAFDEQDACRQYYWLLFLSDRFKKDAGIDTE